MPQDILKYPIYPTSDLETEIVATMSPVNMINGFSEKTDVVSKNENDLVNNAEKKMGSEELTASSQSIKSTMDTSVLSVKPHSFITPHISSHVT